jgi:hypothetical protein
MKKYCKDGIRAGGVNHTKKKTKKKHGDKINASGGNENMKSNHRAFFMMR